MEASHDHLLVTPPSHFTPQKVKGLLLVDSLRVGKILPMITQMESLSRIICVLDEKMKFIKKATGYGEKDICMDNEIEISNDP